MGSLEPWRAARAKHRDDGHPTNKSTSCSFLAVRSRSRHLSWRP